MDNDAKFLNISGINDYASALEWITQFSPCYRANPNDATIFAWIHSHVEGNSCFLSSVDLHNQFVYEKLFPHILAIVVEIGKTQVKDVKFYQLSEEGVTKVDDCNLNNNTPSILHESCANDEAFSKN